jgi:hypothetical protein
MDYMENPKIIRSSINLVRELRFNPNLYKVLVTITLVLVFLVSSGSTNSIKSFVNTRSDLNDNNILIKNFVNDASYIDQPTVSKIINTNNTLSYLDGNNKPIFLDRIPQDLTYNQSPTVNPNEIIKPDTPLQLTQLIPPPINIQRRNFLSFPTFNINAPIVYSDYTSSQDTIDPNNPCSQASMKTPLQQLVRKGVVHLFPSPKPGEIYDETKNTYFDSKDKKRYLIGNSYIIGHSSECIQHEFSRVFQPFQDKTPIGDKFIIWDEQGRKLTFKVFEAKEITSYGSGAEEAFGVFPGRRVVTLQTSKFYTNQKINRWIIRGELEIVN